MALEKRKWFRKVQELIKDLGQGSVSELDPYKAYELWANSYDKTEGNALLFADETAVRPLLEKLPLRGKAVLDAGCGTGRYLEALQRHHPRLIVGIDFISGMIKKARKKNNFASVVHFQVAQLEWLPLRDESFDFVLCTLVLGHIVDLESAVAELSRVLRRNGSMIISCFHPYGQLLGWVRTFRPNNSSKWSRRYAARYYRHLHSDFFKAFQLSQLEATQMFEPVIDETLKPYYEQGRRTDLFERYKGFPLLLIFQVRKR